MPDELQWGEISDFTPGIRQRLSPSHPAGTAQDEFTFGCRAHPSGGSLVPLPKLVNEYSHDLSGFMGNVVDTLLSEEVRIAGIFCSGPSYYPFAPDVGVDQNNTELWMAFESYIGPNNASAQYRAIVDRLMLNRSANVKWENVWSVAESLVFDPLTRPRRAEFVDTRSNSDGDPESDQNMLAGPAVTVFVFKGYLKYFPTEDAQGTNIVRNMPGDQEEGATPLVFPDSICGHQGRVVVLPISFYGHGVDTVHVQNEAFYYTRVNDHQFLDPFLDGNYLNIVAGYENPSGIGVLQSLTANKLLFIKGSGGAFVLTGDLNDHTIESLQNVRGTGLSMNRGTHTPIGFMYPVDGSGVWLWEGGDISQHLTPFMDADFWRPAPLVPASALSSNQQIEAGWGYGFTQCAQWAQYVLFPNNWLYDTDTKAWWRIADTDRFVIHKWAADWRGYSAYGAPSGFNTSQDTVAYRFDLPVLSDKYSWQSQPISASIDRDIRLHEVIWTGSGKGKIRISARTYEHPEPVVTEIMEVDAPDRVVSIRKKLAINGTSCEIRIQAEGATSNTEAPETNSLRYSYMSGSRISREA